MSHSNYQTFIFVIATATLLLITPPLLAADKIERNKHIFDTYTDRTPLLTAFPNYPSIARRDRIEGDTTVCFYIDTNGRIRKARVQSTTHPIFKRAALRAIRASSFKPLAPSQALTTARVCRTYRFRLTSLLGEEA